ncbi:MAG: carbohydrate binding domain-containing protein [Flavobacterium sp.]
MKYIKFFSFLFLSALMIGCSDDEAVKTKETIASYTYIREATAGRITLINTSQNADTFEWYFGDVTNPTVPSSTLKDPLINFTMTGDYEVTLVAKNSKTGATSTFSSIISVFIFQGGLVQNGDFESGTNSWNFGVANPMPAGWLVTQNGNTYASVNVTAAGNPFDVNLSQLGINMTSGTTYRLTFDAWSDVNRSMVVGIGLSGAPWTNQSVVRNLNSTVQNFSIDLVANFSSNNSRVIFDLGAAVGRVNIDNVTLNPVP